MEGIPFAGSRNEIPRYGVVLEGSGFRHDPENLVLSMIYVTDKNP
jgi:hypothetical protein